jgi:hypothetical protein
VPVGVNIVNSAGTAAIAADSGGQANILGNGITLNSNGFGNRLLGAQTYTLDNLSASTTLTAAHFAVMVDASGAARTITLPAASTITGRVYIIKKTDSSTNTVTVDGNASETIDGALTRKLYEQYESITIQSDGTNWKIIASTGVPKSYDGTRWLGPPMLFPLHNYLSSPPYSADTEALAGSIPGNNAFYVERWDLSFFVASGLDASNYWTIRLRRLTSGSSLDTIKDHSTQSLTNNVWQKLSATSGFTNNPMNSTDIWLQVYLIKTGAPNSIYIQSQVYGRMVYT